MVGDGCTDASGDILATHFADEVRWTNLARNSGGQSTPNNEGIRPRENAHRLSGARRRGRRTIRRLAGVVQAHDPDFAVSGAVYRDRPDRGSTRSQEVRRSSAASREFPPSSFAPPGMWTASDPGASRRAARGRGLRIPLRAVKAGCTFASTQAITVHKFAVGHRYLRTGSRRAGSGRALERLNAGRRGAAPDEIAADIATAPSAHRSATSISRPTLPAAVPTDLATKGLRASVPALVHAPCRFAVDDAPAGLDWYPLERDPRLGPFRWSGPNSTRHLIPARVAGRFSCASGCRVRRAASRVVAITLEVDGRGRRSPSRRLRTERRCSPSRRSTARRRRHRRELPPAPVRSALERSATQARRARARRHRGRAAGSAAAHHAYGMRSRAACESQGRSSASGCS